MLAVDFFIFGLLFILVGVLYYVIWDISRKRFYTIINHSKGVILSSMTVDELTYIAVKHLIDPELRIQLEEKIIEQHKLVQEYEELEF